MPRESLLGGRNANALDERDQTRAYNTFRGLDPEVPVKYVAAAKTVFHEATDDDGNIFGEIIFSEDIYPGMGVVDPNSSLSMQAAVAHELSHYHRWLNKTQLPENDCVEIDEALTSLEAILRYQKQLNEHDTRQLVSDAIQRLQIFAQKNVSRKKLIAAKP